MNGSYKDEVIEGEAQRGEVGEAGGEIILGQVILHKIQDLVISNGHVRSHLEILSKPKAVTKVFKISIN